MAVCDNKPPHRGFIVAPSYEMVEVPEREFLKLAKPILKRTRSLFGRKIHEFKNGHVVEIKTGDEPDRFRGSQYAWGWADEIAKMDKSALDIIHPCLMAYRGKLWGTTTPRGRNFIYDDWYLRTCEWHPNYDSEYDVVKVTSHENYYLPEGEVDRLGRRYSDTNRRQEIEAEFVAWEGLVYPEFDVAIHVIPPIEHDDVRVKSVLAACDFGVNDPLCYLWAAKIDGRMVIVDEYYQAGKASDFHAPRIVANPWQSRVRICYGDYHSPEGISALRRYGIPCIAARGHEIPIGVNEVRRLLGGLMPDGKPSLLVSARCVNLIREIGAYRYPEGRATRTVGDIPLDVDSHSMDALRYLIFSERGVDYLGPVKEIPRVPGPGTYGFAKKHWFPSRSGNIRVNTKRAYA